MLPFWQPKKYLNASAIKVCEWLSGSFGIYLWPLGSATSKVLNTALERSVHLANLTAANQFTFFAAGIECNISLTHSCMVASSQ